MQARNPPLSICLQHLIICFICDVYRTYPSPLCWGNFINYIFSISLANDFLLTVETELKVTQSALDVHMECTPFVKD